MKNAEKNLILLLLALALVLSGCKAPDTNIGDPEPEWTKAIYQSIIVEGDKEWLEILIEGEVQKFLIREKSTEYAAIPDFIQYGDEIGLYYTWNSGKEKVVLEITSPDLFD